MWLPYLYTQIRLAPNSIKPTCWRILWYILSNKNNTRPKQSPSDPALSQTAKLGSALSQTALSFDSAVFLTMLISTQPVSHSFWASTVITTLNQSRITMSASYRTMLTLMRNKQSWTMPPLCPHNSGLANHIVSQLTIFAVLETTFCLWTKTIALWGRTHRAMLRYNNNNYFYDVRLAQRLFSNSERSRNPTCTVLNVHITGIPPHTIHLL